MTQKIAAPFLTNAVWAPTGYGTQAAQLIPRMNADGHAISVAANYGLQAMMTQYNGVTHYPMGNEQWSNDTIEPIFKDWTRQFPDHRPMTFVLFDAWPLAGAQWDRLDTAIWTMVDHTPVPPAVLKFLMKPNVTPIAPTRFAKQQIEATGVECLYAPMAIDTKVYQPAATFTTGDGRTMTGAQLMGWDDDPDNTEHFTVSLVNANKGLPGRKAWGENLLALSVFMQRHPDVRAYLHTERYGTHTGHHMDTLLKAVGIPEDRVRFVNQWAQHMNIPNEGMAAIYTATDVLLASTYGEGFGLTTLEAASCGTPVIGNDFTCQPEMIGEGWLTENQPWWNGPQLAWWAIPLVPSILDCLEQAYERGKGRSQKQIDHAAMYDADRVFDTYWRPALEHLADSGTSAAVDPAPVSTSAPLLTVYIPTARPIELEQLLASLAPQLTGEVEVVISDNHGGGREVVDRHLAGSPATVTYTANPVDIGGDPNILRGFHAGTAPWLWLVGDDDEILPGAVARILTAIRSDDIDRLILLSDRAPRLAAGASGSIADIAALDPGLPVAATLITANVVRRAALDLRRANAHADTKYGHAWANTSCKRIKVLDRPAIKVGADHAGEGVPADFNFGAVMHDLLTKGYRLPFGPEAFTWNFVSAERAS